MEREVQELNEDDEFEDDDEIDPLEPGVTYRRPSPKIGRNEPCPCGSGKKFKKCHGGTG